MSIAYFVKEFVKPFCIPGVFSAQVSSKRIVIIGLESPCLYSNLR
jgi:hypothetical protein